MKQYLVSVYSVEGAPDMSDEDTARMYGQTDRLNKELVAAGVWVFGGGLLPADSATVVRTDRGVTSMSDGPFAETKEHIAGFWVLKCDDLDQALAWAEKCSAACMAPIEIRPFDALSTAD